MKRKRLQLGKLERLEKTNSTGSHRSARDMLRTVYLAGALTMAGCDPGFVRINFEWPNGRPTFSPDVPATSTIKIEQRTDPTQPGPQIVPPVQFPFEQGKTRIPFVPYHVPNLVIVAEVAESPTADPIYYGRSVPFIHQAGQAPGAGHRNATDPRSAGPRR